jgi:hypothetical protein
MGESLFEIDGDEQVREVMAELHLVPGWPVDPVQDEMFVREMQRQFPALALVDEIRAYAAWMLDHKTKKKVRHHARFRNWCAQAVRFGRRTDRPVRSPGTQVGRVGAAPEGIDAHGTVSGRIEKW